MPSLAADGSADADAPDRVQIDRDDPADRWRYTCPRGHRDWSPTNSHAWCYSCSRAERQGAAVDPEHYALYDQRAGERVPWSAIDIE